MAGSTKEPSPAAFRRLLGGGDRRSIGEVAKIVRMVCADPAAFGQLVPLMQDGDPLVAMRACDAVEKISAARPALLAPHADFILTEVARRPEAEVRWHVAQMIPRLPLTARRRAAAAALLRAYLQDGSRIVRACALDAFWRLAQKDTRLHDEAAALVTKAAASEAPAVRARARKLLKER
jgi:hypothetical protein